MGHKAHPTSLRLGFVKNWNSRWYAKRGQYAQWLKQDIDIRQWLLKSLQKAAVASVEIERSAEKVRVIINTARPGVIIGRRGAEIDRVRDELHEMLQQEVVLDIREIKMPATEAQLIAQNIAFQLQKRIAFRRAMKKAIQLARDQGVQGIKVACRGRLGGSEIAREESYLEGKVPRGTFRANIDYGFAESFTTYGVIGVKVWVYKGDILPEHAVPPAPPSDATPQVATTSGTPVSEGQ